MISAEQLNKDVDLNSIVIVQRDVLLSQGNRAFIEYYDEYGYGFMYLGKDDFVDAEHVSVIIPNTTSIRPFEYRCYVNLFCRCDCKIINTNTVNLLHNMPLVERIDSFRELNRKFA